MGGVWHAAAEVQTNVVATNPAMVGRRVKLPKQKFLGEAEWRDYLSVCETNERLLATLNDIKRLLKSCAYKEEAETIKLLKDLCGVA